MRLIKQTEEYTVDTEQAADIHTKPKKLKVK